MVVVPAETKTLVAVIFGEFAEFAGQFGPLLVGLFPIFLSDERAEDGLQAERLGEFGGFGLVAQLVEPDMTGWHGQPAGVEVAAQPGRIGIERAEPFNAGVAKT